MPTIIILKTTTPIINVVLNNFSIDGPVISLLFAIYIILANFSIYYINKLILAIYL